MIDHHVDRPDVEARQRVQLTGPNRPIGSITTTMHSNHRRYAITPNSIRNHARTKPTRSRANVASVDASSTPPHPRACCLDDLVAMAGGLHPIPSRTRT